MHRVVLTLAACTLRFQRLYSANPPSTVQVPACGKQAISTSRRFWAGENTSESGAWAGYPAEIRNPL